MVKKYKEILRYHSNGFSQRQIASLTGVSRGTVIKVIDTFKCANVSWVEVI
ncbi:helix-turn-helix domain-containing protein [Faecalitalea cylindroides]|uniref:helix-turn-helix domain-containing protein n=1 Tax=Faecalitalea cylindroides TaxID=39483 RepID=UPI00117BDCBC|nr:helix-turn-helix domain-containing protein [Faecalitalea cylindroides]